MVEIIPQENCASHTHVQPISKKVTDTQGDALAGRLKPSPSRRGEPPSGPGKVTHLIGLDHVLAVLADLLGLLFGLRQPGGGLPQLVLGFLNQRREN